MALKLPGKRAGSIQVFVLNISLNLIQNFALHGFRSRFCHLIIRRKRGQLLDELGRISRGWSKVIAGSQGGCELSVQFIDFHFLQVRQDRRDKGFLLLGLPLEILQLLESRQRLEGRLSKIQQCQPCIFPVLNLLCRLKFLPVMVNDLLLEREDGFVLRLFPQDQITLIAGF